MSEYLVSLDGSLWSYDDDGSFNKIDTNLTFHPNQHPTSSYLLTTLGEIYNAKTNEIRDIPYTITSIAVSASIIYAVTDDRILIRIGKQFAVDHGRFIRLHVDLDDIAIVARDIDYIIGQTGSRSIVIRNNQDGNASWLVIHSNNEHDLIELPEDAQPEEINFRPDILRLIKESNVQLVEEVIDMPSTRDLIIIRGSIVACD